MAGKLQHELKKRHPFDDAATELGLAVLRTADQLQLLTERLLRGYGLTPAQYNVLRILRGEGGPLPILEIAARTICVVPGITRVIDRLEAQGLARRVRSTSDRRVIYVELTPGARKRLAELDEPLQRLHREVLAGADTSQFPAMLQVLEQWRENMGRMGATLAGLPAAAGAPTE